MASSSQGVAPGRAGAGLSKTASFTQHLKIHKYLQALTGYPEEVLIFLEVHSEPLRILDNLVFRWNVIGVYLLFKNDAVDNQK
jgi:hypothetical protein